MCNAPALPLTQLEKDLFNLLLEVVHHEKLSNLTLRVAGGWVRDKLLQQNLPTTCPTKQSAPDIDIALDTMLGREFAERVNSYLKQRAIPTATVGLIQKNPDQSKHLETATMRVMGVWLDLVNLRTETYSHDSRIPDVQIGTPYEDAMRRDLTINALFYNINNDTIEDHTNRGFDDIRARIVRTPLPPLTTLLDDPLRALRAIRFASRLNFSFDPDLFAACRNPRVHQALGAKVSRERISTEIDLVMASARPCHSIGLLVELGLFPVVFRLPSEEHFITDIRPPPDFPTAALGSLINLLSLPDIPPAPERRLVCYAAMLSPVATSQCLFGQPGKRRKPASLTHYMLRSELRLAAKDAADVCEMQQAALKLKALVHRGAANVDRLTLGRAIRCAGACWRAALQVALVTEMEPPRAVQSYAECSDTAPEQFSSEIKVVVDTYAAFRERVEQLGLDGVWDVKPFVNGNQLMSVLPRLKKGPIIGKIMSEQIDWMIRNPSKGVEEVKNWMRETYSQFT